MTPQKFLVNGEWRSSARVRTIINPYSSESAGEVFQALPQDVDDAIGGAVAAFASTRALQAFERADILHSISHRIESSKEDFARTITAETGKPISYSRSEVERSIFTFTVAAEEASRIGGEVLPLDLAPHSASRTGIIRRFPIGPIAAITPFNFPINLVAHKVAPAIASGNPIVLKPSSSGALTALLLGRIVQDSGYPSGGLSIVTSSASDSSQLIQDERVKLISFTGSPEVGWGIKSAAGKKKVVLELGGNAGVVVDKGMDLDTIIPRIVQGSFGNAGQSCIAVQRIFVHEELYDEFERLFVEATSTIMVGDPYDDRTVVGPMIDEDSAAKVEVWLKEALSMGARILCGGSRKGAVLEPTVVTDVKKEMNVSCKEVFAPVVTLERVKSLEEGVDKVNDSEFGLQAGLFSNDLQGVFTAYEKLDVGGLVVNDFPTYRIDHMPYGGVKNSGFGREGVRYAIESMTEPKLMVLNLSR